jgi:hypothetical protein
MPKKSRRGLEAYLRARGAVTQAEIDAVLEEWRVVVRESTRQALKGPGGTVVVQATGKKSKKELLTLQAGAIAADESPAEVEELPSEDEETQ